MKWFAKPRCNMKLDDKTRLEHMLESAQEAISFLGRMTVNVKINSVIILCRS